MVYNSTEAYLKLLDDLAADQNVSDTTLTTLTGYVKSIYRSELQNKYAEPMLWIGMYIALASLLCILAMLADLLHGLRNRKFWIPSKYFSINATSLLLISVAMKLPVDLSGAMPGDVDQAAKLGSLAFMCTMMANLLLSLAAMDSKELLSNITALGILVITLVVNVCIQIDTGVVSISEKAQLAKTVAENVNLKSLGVTNKHRNGIFATIYVTIMLVLLIIYVCSSLAILKSKQIIESKYQQHHETASKQSPGGSLSVEKLQDHVRNYWIMAGSGSPQFITACSVTTTASGVLCVVPTVLHTLTMSWTIHAMLKKDYDSDYKWSMLVILIVQFIGVIVGTIAPFSRCFATLSFKVSNKSIPNHIKVFKVESYWSSKLSEWKQGSIPFPFRGNKLETVIHYSRKIIMSFCIELQEGVVVMCKIIALIPFFIMICVLYCFRCLKLLTKPICHTEKSVQDKHLREYILQLEDEKELAERTLEGLLKSVKRLIRKGEKRHPKYLTNLIVEKSTRHFPGVENFDDGSSLSKKYQDCWSLPVVTLTTIAVSLPDIEKEHIDSLLKSVREGLKYITLVEESLLNNGATGDDYASVQKAADALWSEVNFHRKWLGNELQKAASSCDQADKTSQVIEWFKDTARKMESSQVGNTVICASSMYRITKTILQSYQADTDDKVSQKQLFDKLSSMIADIMGACLTNLPQVIAMKCHTSEIEKREASVRATAKLLGKTKQIITTFQDRQPSRMNPNDLPFLDKWRAYLADLRNP